MAEPLDRFQLLQVEEFAKEVKQLENTFGLVWERNEKLREDVAELKDEIRVLRKIILALYDTRKKTR